LNITPAAGSKVTATMKQEGVEVESPFTKFSGRIAYDPAKVASSTAVIEVETGSFDFGDEAYNAEVRKKSWFDSATYPKAKFQSTSIQPAAAGSFQATGQLTVKGRAQTITVPVKVSNSPAGMVFDGSFAMSRKAFGIGDPVWDGTVDDKVVVKFHLVGGK
jgi:polyisoprenoid-binding protein YceI